MPAGEVLLTFTSDGRFLPVMDASRSCSSACIPMTWRPIAQMDRYFTKDKRGMLTTSPGERRSRSLPATWQNASPGRFARASNSDRRARASTSLLTLVGDNYVVESRTDAGMRWWLWRGICPRPIGESGEARAGVAGMRGSCWAERTSPVPCGRNCPGCWKNRTTSGVDRRKPDVLLLRVVRDGLPSLLLLRRAGRSGVDLASGKRNRRWDGCLLSDFAHGGGGA